MTGKPKAQSYNHASSTNNAIDTYIVNVGIMSESTAYQYLSRLNDFKEFMVNEYGNHSNIDDLTK